MTGKVQPLRQGMASLTLVLIVTALIAIIMVPIFLVTYIRNTQAVRFHHSQQAFFAAEGAYAETVARLKLHDAWGRNGVNDIYFVGPNEISRSVVWFEIPGEFQITITANNRLAQRKIEGVFTPAGTTTTSAKYDLVLVLDYSSSMGENCTSPDCPIDYLKEAASNLLSNRLRNVDNRVGLVIFSDDATSHHGFNDATDLHINDLILVINSRNAGGATNLGGGLYKAVDMLNTAVYRPDSERIIILFSDGVPNHVLDNAAYPKAECATAYSPVSYKQPCACDNNECTQPESDYTGDYYDIFGGPRILYSPAQYVGPDLEHYGSFCTKQAIQIAHDAKNNVNPDLNISFYTVFLQYASKAFCKTDSNFLQPTLSPTDPTDIALAQRVITLGRLTNFFISSESEGTDPYHFSDTNDYEFYKEAATASELNDIFNNIIDTIASGGSSTYYETVPD